jgi:hypothetical protein
MFFGLFRGMRLFLFCAVSLIFSALSLSAQERPNTPQAQFTTRIVKSTLTDSVPMKVQMIGVSYDGERTQLPFFLLSRTTSIRESAKPTLIIRRTAIVTGQHAAAIRKFYAKYLGSDFELVQRPSLARGQNLNHYRLYPFRINATGQIEELLDYEITWQVVTASADVQGRQRSSFAQASVLSTGTWFKIAVTQTGLHRITRSFLTSIGMRNIDPAAIRVYGNGGAMVPERNGDDRPDDLVENPLLLVDGGDGSFDNQDYVLFFATGPTKWVKGKPGDLKFRGIKNFYSDTSFYYVTADNGPGKRISTQSSAEGPNVQTTSYDYYAMHEENLVNLAKSGREFLGEYFDVITSYQFSWADGNFVTGDSILVEASVAAAGRDSTQFLVYGNGVNGSLAAGALPGGAHQPYAIAGLKLFSALNTSANDLLITVNKPGNKNIGWLNRLTVNMRRNLVVGSRQFQFRDMRVCAPGNVCRYQISTTSSAVQVWNVTDHLNPFIQTTETGEGMVAFNAPSDNLNEYCIAPTSDLYTPVFVGKVANQNLHGITQADYLIITHPLFVKEATRLGAFHQKMEGLTYAVATVDQVYNEFGSGRPDIGAIRDFIRMVYSRNISQRPLKYVVLIGDGSYNNKNRGLLNNSAFIPTYQSHSSFSSTESVVTDDFFALMDPHEGENAESSGNVDIGLGRFPCRTNNEVKGIIEKIENYYKKDPNFNINAGHELYNPLNESPMGDWRNWLLFLGDDGDNALHMSQSDELTQIVKSINPIFNFDKIMLDAYQRFSTPGGVRYPDASEDYLRRMKRGALLFNYTGHGGEVGLTGERIIDVEIINNLDNFNKLPLFVTATCEFSRYDDPLRTSAGELSLLNPRGGAVALMTTSRLAYASFNFQLNDTLVRKLFTKNPDGTWPALGDVMQHTKSSIGQSYFFAHFHLLGDPALVLAYPEHRVMTTMVNGRQIDSNTMDTLSALAKVTVSGFVADQAGNKISNFNGVVYPSVFDKEQEVVSLINDPESSLSDNDRVPFRFKLQKNILYRGKAEVKNGDFTFTFMVPKDVSFSAGKSKIGYYATNGQTDAAGAYLNLIAGGDSRNTVTDNEGPQISIFLNDKNFVSGGITNEEPVLYADLADSSGINTAGSGLGHDLTAVIDGESGKPVVLNDFYEANLNSYQSGRVRYPFNELSNGRHTLTVKAWDIQNNSSTATTDFIVEESAVLALQNVLNYPNPFTTHTKFFFQHNQGCDPLKVLVQVYTVTGKLVKTLNQQVTCSGLQPEGIDWDGRDDFGDRLARGVYVYRLAILDINNKKAEKIEKLVILN